MDHREAFCLMQYQCDKCQHITSIWNSRDGVTPFVLGSRCCPGERAQHINFQLDRPFDQLPETASHVFIDMTRERAEQLAQRFWDTHGEAMLAQYDHLREMGKEELMAGKVEDIYNEGKAPDLITRGDYLASFMEHEDADD